MSTHPPGKKANRLIHAASPYLQQHAHNPVDWFEWGEEALSKAKREDKPILVSIGYSSCHWCHVMERESFEMEEIAQVMNENFVCIKVDREERPDIDHLYMEAVQVMGMNGGWPLNVFLTPDQKPFYGGTYFPPRNWTQLLQQISKAFLKDRPDIDGTATEIAERLALSDLDRFKKDSAGPGPERKDLDQMFRTLVTRFDRTWGGMDKAPKFVMPTIWLFLLRYYHLSKEKEALRMVTLTLTRISEGGLYDQLGGGFARYSVDGKWFAPHFEKMLYDNAQLLSLYAEAYSLTHDERYRHIVFETTDWLAREMRHPEGGFYSALDADSEGEEGKFYTWTANEIATTLGDRSGSFSDVFQITDEGNWEHGRNILTLAPDGKDDAALASEKSLLLHVRDQRIRPSLDDKILTGWNAMMIQGLLDAFRAFGDHHFLELALEGMHFIEHYLIADGKVYRSFRGRRSATEGFLEDYASLIRAYLALYQSTFHEDWLGKAQAWCTYTVDHFYDEGDGFFHLSGNQSERLIARKKEVFDNVIPASNSVMAHNLFHLGIMLDQSDWKEKAKAMVLSLREIILSEPSYLSHWGILLCEMIHGISEVVISGPEAEEKRKTLCKHPTPFAVLMGTTTTSAMPHFEGRLATDGKTRIYVCVNKTCKLPVESPEEALQQLAAN